MSVVTISVQLNTYRDRHHLIQISEHELATLNAHHLYQYVAKKCKGKFRLKISITKLRFFILPTGEELSEDNITTFLSAHYTSTLKHGLTLLVSCGEEYIGKKEQPAFKRGNERDAVLAIFIQCNESEHSAHVSELECITQDIFSFLPTSKPLPPMSVATQTVLRQMTKIMSAGNKTAKQRFRDIYRDCTRSIYCALRDECSVDNSAVPSGLTCQYNDNISLLAAAATQEVDAILELLLSKKPELKSSSNLKFYVNTAYYSRWENDRWPMFSVNDARVQNIMQCIRSAMQLLDIHRHSQSDNKLLNIIIRQYRVGDVLGFHTDRDEFVEPICGVVLRNTHRDKHGLMFYKDTIKPFMSDEKQGLCWCLRGEARWDYKHGLCAPFDGPKKQNGKRNRRKTQKEARGRTTEYTSLDSEPNVFRTSITFRWFRHDATIPPHNQENDL